MERSVVRAAVFSLLLALVITLPNKDDWDIYSFHVNSTVTGRYATTVITSRVVNRMDESKEIEFHVRIPKNAFITRFRMLMDGQMYDGVVKVKEEAQQQYASAVARGESAGIVSSVGRTLEEFKTSVTVAAHNKVTFELTYEELLRRRLGKYELQIHARPLQAVRDFKIDVHINENAGINFLEVRGGLSTKALAKAITTTVSDKQAWVHFYPTEDQQKQCDSCGEQGMNGDLVIVYDVKRDNMLGDIKESNGYFVHHFAPVSLPRIPKNVVFVIDRSGSMHGTKIRQTRIALVHILGDLSEDDNFGLITFDSQISPWRHELLQANEANLNAAKEFARSIEQRGATDINGAVLEGARMLNNHPREGAASILILLTDGDPTTGVTDRGVIRANVREAINKKFPLYCLGFGFDVDFDFLETMALENSGTARRIYEDSDANLQLKGFYEEVATPLLIDVTMSYNSGTNLTQTSFSHYYNGSEIVVAGQITDNDIETFSPQVVAISRHRKMIIAEDNSTMKTSESTADHYVQRVWAYLTVKQLLDKELRLAGEEKARVKKEALELSLKYNFVTPLTSMVVTKPPGENTEVLHKPKEDGKHMLPTLNRFYSSPGLAARAGLPGRPGPPGLPGPPGASGHMHMSVQAKHAPSAPRHRHIGFAPPMMFDFMHTGVGVGISAAAPDYDDVYDVAVAVLPTSTAQPDPVPGPVHRFLRRAVNHSMPLCFDITGAQQLKLLDNPSREFWVSGELHSAAEGFSNIIIRQAASTLIQISPTRVTVQEGQNQTTYPLQDIITVGRITIISRHNEIDVSDGDARMLLLVHHKAGQTFMWPVLRQWPSGDHIQGLLALMPLDYEEFPQIHKLGVNGQMIDASRDVVMDFSISSAPSQDCWLTSPQSALQREPQDFIVS